MSEIEWTPEKRALAWQWLIGKRLTSIREKVPPEVFSGFAESLDLLIAPMEQVSKNGN